MTAGIVDDGIGGGFAATNPPNYKWRYVISSAARNLNLMTLKPRQLGNYNSCDKAITIVIIIR